MTAKKIYELHIKYNLNICIDSRSSDIKGSVFFGINGDNFNGSDFAEDALKNGARIAIVDNYNKSNNSIIVVEDSLRTLQDIATIHRSRFDIPIIAITGSNGKTTTKDILTKILSSKYKTCNTEGNFNNHIGVPLTLLSLTESHQIAVIEMGASHMGEIKKLCKIIKPSHGIITNIGSAHIGKYGNIKNIIKAKNELFDYLKQTNGLIIFNQDDTILKKLINSYSNIIGYTQPKIASNEQERKNVSLATYQCRPFITLYNCYNINIITSSIIGSYNINNIISSISIAKVFKVPDTKIKSSIENIILKNNRSEFIETPSNNIVLDAYNANPTSMEKAIINFIEINYFLKYKDMLFILGDMLELGSKQVNYHQNIIDLLERNHVTNCILVGELFNKTTSKFNYQKATSIWECIDIIKNQAIERKSIFIKGSRHISLERIVQYL